MAAGLGSDLIAVGAVTGIDYRGRGYDHVVICSAGPLVVVFDPDPHPRGTAIEIAFGPEGCVAYPTSGEQCVTTTA